MSSKETRIFYDIDADPARLHNRVVAVIGYGSQGHAHALNLRDSGVGARVVVGLRPGGGSWERARAEGLDVRPVAEAARAADVIMMLVPDQEARAVYEAGIAPALQRGKTLLFAHGFNIHFREIVPPAGADVAMLAPKYPGHLVRSDHRHFCTSRRDDLPEVDIEPVGKEQGLAALQSRRDAGLVHRPCFLVGNEHHDDVGRARRLRDRPHVQTLGPGALP